MKTKIFLILFLCLFISTKLQADIMPQLREEIRSFYFNDTNLPDDELEDNLVLKFKGETACKILDMYLNNKEYCNLRIGDGDIVHIFTAKEDNLYITLSVAFYMNNNFVKDVKIVTSAYIK